MKIIINCYKLLQVLTRINFIQSGKSDISILSNVKITVSKGEISFCTTDNDLFVIEKINLLTSKEFSTTVPMYQFFEIIRKFDKGSNISLEFDPIDEPVRMTITSGNARLTLPCIASVYFPHFTCKNFICNFSLKKKQINYLLSITNHASSLDDVRYVLNGIFLHTVNKENFTFLRTIATDSHRLAIADIKLSSNLFISFDVIIPKKMVLELLKVLGKTQDDIKISVFKNKIIFTINNTVLLSRLIDGIYPNCQHILSNFTSTKNKIRVNVNFLIQAINLATTILNERLKIVNLKFIKNTLFVSSHHKENTTGIIKVPIIYNRVEFKILFNAKYIINILSTINGKNIVIELKYNNFVFVIKDSNNIYSCFAIMPIE